jgi:MFS family permease
LAPGVHGRLGFSNLQGLILRGKLGQYSLTFLLMFAIGIAAPISPLLASRIGATWVEIGLMGTAWGLVFMLWAVPVGRISDRVGRRPILLLSAGLSALAALLYLRATNVWELIAIRAVEGLAWGCFWPIMEALSTETAETGKVGRGIGAVTTIYAFGFLIGSFAGGAITDAIGFPAAFAVYLGIACISLLPAWFTDDSAVLRMDPARPSSGLRPRILKRGVLVGISLGAAYTFGLASVMSLFSVYALGLGLAVLWVGVAVSAFWAGRILGAALAGAGSDRAGRKIVAQLAFAIGAIGFFIVALAIDLALVVVGALLAGVSVGAIFPVSVAMVADTIGDELRGTAMGLYEMACAVAFMIASAVGGALAQVVNPAMPYWLSAFVYTSCVILIVLLVRPVSRKT